MKKFMSIDQARPAKKQHKTPCADCPFARTAMRGWLGSVSLDDWVVAIHAESIINCHTVSNQQCAGAAIFRANVCKMPRDPQILQLRKNTSLVFSSTMEFWIHHH